MERIIDILLINIITYEETSNLEYDPEAKCHSMLWKTPTSSIKKKAHELVNQN